MKSGASKSTTAPAAKSGRYRPTTSPATKRAIETYRAIRAAAGKPVPKIH
jgi:hypothetical protein